MNLVNKIIYSRFIRDRETGKCIPIKVLAMEAGYYSVDYGGSGGIEQWNKEHVERALEIGDTSMVPFYTFNPPDFGDCAILVSVLAEQWTDEAFAISEWHSEFRLIDRSLLYPRRYQISQAMAQFIIEKLNLVKTPSSVFTSGAMWRKTFGER
jgi:hypothetical protein